MKREPTMEEIRRAVLVGAGEGTVLIGGMAVSFMAASYGADSGVPCITRDADFFGDALAVEDAAFRLERSGYKAEVFMATMDDANTPNPGKIVVEISPDAHPVEIDFLARIDGLSSDEIERTAASILVDGASLRVEHPILLLENKINNLALYPAKRNEAGVNQARLSIIIARKLLERSRSQRDLLRAVERIWRLSMREGACFVFSAFGLDVLNAVPTESVTSPEFSDKRWPQITALTQERRTKFESLRKRAKTGSSFMKRRFGI